MLLELARGLTDSQAPAFRIERQELLESALALPHQPYYETFYDKLAALVRSIAANHALVDGNKRLAAAVLHSTLLVNGLAYFWDDVDAAELVLRCASGETDYRWLALFIEAWTGAGSAIPLDVPDIIEAIRTRRADAEAASASATLTDILAGFVPELLHAVTAAHARGDLSPGATDALLTYLRETRDAAAP